MKKRMSIKLVIVLTALMALTEILSLIIVGEPANLPVTGGLAVVLWVVYFIEGIIHSKNKK